MVSFQSRYSKELKSVHKLLIGTAEKRLLPDSILTWVAFDDDLESFEDEDDCSNDENISASMVKCLKLQATETEKLLAPANWYWFETVTTNQEHTCQ